MKINPNDPWYPAPWVCVNGDKNYDGYPGVSIRMKLAAGFAKALINSRPQPLPAQDVVTKSFTNLNVEHQSMNGLGLLMADDLIARTNRDEETDDDVRNVPDRKSNAHDCGGTGYSRVWPDRGQGPFVTFNATSDDLHCELCERTTQAIHVCTRCQCIICHACFLTHKRAAGKADRDEGKAG